MVVLCWMLGLSPGWGAFVVRADRPEEIFVRVADTQDEEMRQRAETMSALLERMFGRPFPVRGMEERNGFLLGTATEFPEFSGELTTNSPSEADTYVLRSFGEGMYLVGNSRVGLDNAIWGLMQELGYRHYFPNPKWEIVPQLESFTFEMDRVFQPSFAARILSIGGNTWPELRQEYRVWQERNRLLAGFSLRTGHAYDGIESRNREKLSQIPDYLSLPIGTPNNKFVVAEKGLRDLVVEDALAQLIKQPQMDSISMDPSDGGGWPADSSLGSPSNQAVTLANEVAAALQQVRPGIKVGMYAYNEHSAPPTIDVHPEVIVSVATAFIRGGHRFEDLIKGWSARGAQIGVRDYLGVYSWDFDMPGKPRASSPRRLAELLAGYYALGARYFVAEMNHGFGSSGPGLYVAARCLWDINEANRVDDLLNEFYEKAFGPAEVPMRRFYQQIDADQSPLISPYLWGRLCRLLKEAYQLAAGDAAVVARIDDLAAYTKYLTLYSDYAQSEGADRQEAFSQLTDFAKRIRASGMVHTWGMLRHHPRRDQGLAGPLDLGKMAREAQKSLPPSHSELQTWVDEGASLYPELSFEPIAFSNHLVPRTIEHKSTAPENHLLRLRRGNELYTWLPEPGTIRFSVRGGTTHGNRGPVEIKLYPALEPLGAAVAEIKVPADGQQHAVELVSSFEGLHRLEIQDGGDLTHLTWPKDLPLTLPSGPEKNSTLHHRHDLSFYVPKGTPVVAGYSTTTTGEIIGPDGRSLFSFSTLPGAGFFEVPVPEGMDGKFWKLKQVTGQRLLMTVPPFLAPHPDLLLVPEEITSEFAAPPEKVF